MPKENNFDFLRFMFALFVIITHSYAATGVSEQNDPLYSLTNGSLAFSSLGLSGFFIISGYLILESLKRSQSLGDYYFKRVLRIYPAFVVVLLLTMLLGIIVSALPPMEYLTNGDALSYLLHNVSMANPQHTIKGVYEDHLFPSVINASLWTIPYEFLFYILLSSLYFIRTKKKLVLGLLLTAFCIALAVHILYTGRYSAYYSKFLMPYTAFNMWALARFGLFFAAGAVLSAVEINTFRYKKQLMLGALVLFLGLLAFKWFGAAQFVLLPLLVIIFGLSATKGLAGINKQIGGDLSYGIYLYGFLIQQTLLHYFNLDALMLTAVTVPLAIVCGYLSWNLVEKRALRYKKRLTTTPEHLVHC